MITKEIAALKLEDTLKDIIDDWYMHMEEYPELHRYMASYLVKAGIVKTDACSHDFN